MATAAAWGWLAAALHLAAAVLVVAGAAKVLRPTGTAAALRAARLPHSTPLVVGMGTVEVGLGVTVLAFGGRVAAALLAAAYAAVTVFALRQRLAGADCGCFGAAPAPVSSLHVAVDLTFAGVAAVAVAASVPGLPALVAAGPAWTAIGLPATLAVATVLLRLALTALPELLRVMRATAEAA